MSNIVENLKKGQNLSFDESKSLFSNLMEGKYDESSIIEILEAFTKKGETKDELAGGIFVLRDKASKVKIDQNNYDFSGPKWDPEWKPKWIKNPFKNRSKSDASPGVARGSPEVPKS